MWFAIGVGQMGLRPDDFNDLTPAEFFYAWAGWAKANRDAQRQEWERNRDAQRQEWERTRWQTWVLTCIQMEKKDRKEMTQMFPLPWEKASAPKRVKSSAELTPEERQKRVDELMKCVKTKD